MNENQLSKRLARVGELVPEQSRLADIGSDHAYLPVALVLQKKVAFAVAGEVVSGPFEAAKKQVQKNGLNNQITVRLADGLDAVEEADKITAVTICGMGGVLIRDILEAGWTNQRLQGNERLVLQPNIGEKPLRDWLTVHGYTIIDEDILEENNKIYEIIVACRQEVRVAYSEKERLFGPVLLKKQSSIFQKKWQGELKQRETILAQLAKASGDQQVRIQQIEKEITEIKEVLSNES
ncbi:tRNA (adenine22-N1)-methyltransferase [Enterococcus haemoperoxidus ATCC BAA-382]|uniref:tRNA (Adenine22-N1)-methyltransferase n=1 Tax=Enterococcus haemoperoxidus ATCC BAA-382 TaxID=1158608 RepID=R2SWD9_9ENTE|nr:tRNA (adenine(22)-N(1))-methyltransferase TrmK [Enterococcus haemoperoxidus]EOH99540.1 tRNA (adenine22-N1)-methyltransferase [Enterococcus haemoperoxidus ATCC BAA-382]EOT62720.1 tRNA (adenine22-N1)-methyltransferase [Enterococcus haemoperoxidus ATCC BAA-382]OJG55188.1 tRNA (adenine22-N1)-methyltransferase [Enterococcus haemoperoxidus]